MTDPQRPKPGLSKAARNERRKAVATTLNALAVAAVISAIVQPLISGHIDWARVTGALGAFLVFQSLLHYVLTRVED
ncbi:hypothetical protein [Caulobacter sp. LARHSG274]